MLARIAVSDPPSHRPDILHAGDLESVDQRYAGSHPRDVIAWALSHFAPERRVVVTGLQAEGISVADMAIRIDPTVRIVTIDTGRLPAETYDYLDALQRHWGRPIEIAHPVGEDVERFTDEHGTQPFRGSVPLRFECCHIRKVAPLERALREVDCWLSGLRRGQSVTRASTPLVQNDDRHGGIVKVNPVAAWSLDDARGYLAANGVREHPLYAQGYMSIGCGPCTRPVEAGEDVRAGRWWWESGVAKECGIHTSDVMVNRD